MLKNYIKIAIKVMLRRKFFTAVSLFGISFTLLVLIVATSLVENTFGSKSPEDENYRMLYISILFTKYESNGLRNGPPGFYFLNQYVKALKSPEKVSIYSHIFPTVTYLNNKKIKLFMKFTDKEFWEILNFDFINGKPYTQNEIKNSERVAVINRETSLKYFGSEKSVGKYIEVDKVKYRVIGVVANVAINRINAYSDIWVPYTTSKHDIYKKEYYGSGGQNNYTAMILSQTSKDFKRIKEEFRLTIKKLPKLEPGVLEMKAEAQSLTEAMSTIFLGPESDSKNNLRVVWAMVIILTLLFMLLPALNLLNLNISRIMERASEIAVRKSFGASSKTIVQQFLIENIFITLIGGAIGFLLAFLVLILINSSGIIPHLDLTINLKVFVYGLFMCLFFGLMSGVVPALRMSRLQIVQSLKSSGK